MFAKVTEGWIHKAEQPVQLQQQPVRPQKRHRACKDKAPSYLDPCPETIQEQKRKVQTQQAKCFLGSEELTRLLRTEEWDRTCAVEGSCDTKGRWRIVWRPVAVLKRKPGLADRAWKQNITFKLSFLKVFVENSQVIIQPPRFSKFTKSEKEDYDNNLSQIHLAALAHPTWARGYIPGWVLPIPEQLDFPNQPTECTCKHCSPAGSDSN